MRINITVPTRWDELTPWQAKKIGKMIMDNKPIDEGLYRNLIILILFLPKPSFFNVVKLLLLLWRVPLRELDDYAGFICDGTGSLTVFPAYFTVKDDTGKRLDLQGPAPRLANISIQELSYADAFYYNWRTSGDDIELHRLCAVLYRPAGRQISTVDSRTPFDPLLLPANAELTDQVPLHQKYFVGLAYQGTREVLAKRYRKVFPEKKVAEGEKPKPPGKYAPFTDIITAMALDEVNPFGTLEGAEKANAHKFLDIYNEQLVRMARREAELEKQNRKNKKRG